MPGFEVILGGSEEARSIRDFGRRAAGVDATVLITGESGTGKGLLARAIHDASARGRMAFVAVNCASVPESLFEAEFFGHTRGAFTGAQANRRGLLEQADRGTLFMDEIGELEPALQAKLLTAIEDREFRRLGAERPVRVDVRVIAATGLDLEQAVESRSFRRDLFHRLTVLRIHLPPLRSRVGDIDVFASHYLEVATRRYRRPIRCFDDRALGLIRTYSWPGNIRELANAVESAVLACDGPRIGPAHLPDLIRAGATRPMSGTAGPAGPGVPSRPVGQADPMGRAGRTGQPVAGGPPGLAGHVAAEKAAAGSAAGVAGRPLEIRPRYSHFGSEAEERRRIEDALRRWRGNKTRAARELGMARNTLRGRLSRWRLESADDSRAQSGKAGVEDRAIGDDEPANPAARELRE